MTEVKEKPYIQTILENASPTTRIYSIVRHVSKSGMSRLIDFYVMVDNRPVWVTPAIRDILGYKQDEKTGALKVGGTGMDMCFHVVHSLGYKLHKDGYYFGSERL